MLLVAKFQDESTLIWYYGKDEKQLELCHVSRIIPGQRTVSIINDFLHMWRCLCESLFFTAILFHIIAEYFKLTN